MKDLDKHRLDEALILLGELVQVQPPQHFVVCGGSSLLALGLVNRSTTRDVDLLARVEEGALVTAKPLPDWLVKAVKQVQADLGLPEKWFNTGPSDDSFFRFGLPQGLASRLTTRDYGPSLRISYISRYDQIFFKLYATADTDTGRHYRDLKDLQPTAVELLAAARWTRTQDPSEGFLHVLTKVLGSLGHESLVDQL